MIHYIVAVLYAAISAFAMAYMTFYWQMGPWCAPIFVVVGLLFFMIVSKKQLLVQSSMAILIIGSMGSIGGLALGSTLPAFYLLHVKAFDYWLYHPYIFISAVAAVVALCAGVAVAILYVLQAKVLHKHTLTYPISQFVYDVLYTDRHRNRKKLVLKGLSMAVLWELCMTWIRPFISLIILPMQAAPFMITIGAIIGAAGVVPIMWGMFLQGVALWVATYILKTKFSYQAVVLTVAVGMFLAWLLYEKIQLMLYVMQRLHNKYQKFGMSKMGKEIIILVCIVLVSSLIIVLQSFWIWLTVLIVLFLSYVCSRMVGEIGIVDLQSFALVVVFPLLCFAQFSQFFLLTIAASSFLILGFMVDLLFSAKVSQLHGFKYYEIIKYQILGVFVAAISSAFAVWFCMFKMGMHDNDMVYANAAQLSHFMENNTYDMSILLFGVVLGFIVKTFRLDLLCIAGAVTLSPVMGALLIGSGLATKYIKEPESQYPTLFGFYAGYATVLLVLGVVSIFI